MKKQCVLLAALALACGVPAGFTSVDSNVGFSAVAQTNKVTGVVRDANGDPLIGATVKVKGTTRGTATDIDGKYSIVAAPGNTLVISYVGSQPMEVTVTGSTMDVAMQDNNTNLSEVVVTALGIKKERKSLGYAVDDLKADELMRNKSANPINSLSGKIAGVNITQSSGAAGSGAQIILRGGTSGAESKDNQPLFVVDGVIYDNSSAVVGNSAFDGIMNSATTTSNRVMDINPEDIENMSVLKGPAASALYGSRAANGVVLITTKHGKEGNVEINLSAKYISSSVSNLPKTQKQYGRGYLQDLYDDAGNYQGSRYGNTHSYNSWGAPLSESGSRYYDNIGDFFQTGGIWDTNLSIAAGNKNGNFYFSGSYFDQTGIVPETGYKKTTFRFNGEQRYKIFTVTANAAYSDARTAKTLTGAALYGSSGTGALYAVYNWPTSEPMTRYMNEDGTRYRMFGDEIQPWEEMDNPYWIINKNPMKDNTERFTGNFSVKADLTDWWWVSYRMGVDSYTTDNSMRITRDGVFKNEWLGGFMSDNTLRFRYLSTNLMTNFNKQFGDFNFNLLLGTSTDYTKTRRDYQKGWDFQVADFYSYNNVPDANKKFSHSSSRKRMVSVFGEFRMDWRNAIFLTVTGRNDWASTLPKENWSYFYPSVSGAVAFTELMRESIPDWLSFGKIRGSWAKVGKEADPYVTNTTLWPVGQYLEGAIGLGNSWERGNPYLKPEMGNALEFGLELRFIQNRLKFDITWYKNKSVNQILSPRGPQSTAYIFCSINAGTVYNKGLEVSLSGTPIQTPDFTWETGINAAGNRGTMDGLPEGMDIMYLTDVQYGSAKAATFSGGDFMAIAGTKWARVADTEDNRKYNPDKIGQLILDKNGMPQQAESGKMYEVGNREAKFTGGWNNTLTWKNWSFNMLWEFRVGGDVFNGTKYAMTMSGVSEFSGDIRNQPLTISGVQGEDKVVGKDENGNDIVKTIYNDVSNTWTPGQTCTYNNKQMNGTNVITSYYTGAYGYETANWLTNVNSLRLRSISLSYELPKSLLERTKAIKRAVLTASATNLLLFTNYDGDPEVAAAGAGRGGSSSVGFDYCGVPSTRQFAFGVNLTF